MERVTDTAASDDGDRVTVYPTRVVGTGVGHLALADLRTSPAGELRLIYRALCRDPAEPALLLELVPEGSPLAWCGACADWARRQGVELPAGGADPAPFTG